MPAGIDLVSSSIVSSWFTSGDEPLLYGLVIYANGSVNISSLTGTYLNVLLPHIGQISSIGTTSWHLVHSRLFLIPHSKSLQITVEVSSHQVNLPTYLSSFKK